MRYGELQGLAESNPVVSVRTEATHTLTQFPFFCLPFRTDMPTVHGKLYISK